MEFDIAKDAEQTVILLRKIITELPKIYEFNLTEIQSCEKETQDLLHLIELTNFNASKGYQLSKDIKSIRNKRRQLKDDVSLFEPLIKILSQMKHIEKELNKCLGEVRNIKKRHETRTYKMRVRDDLQKEIV